MPRADADWTPMRGLARAGGVLMLRSVIAMAIWTPLVWITTPFWDFLLVTSGSVVMSGLVGGIMVVAGLAIGYGLCRELTEHAGMASVLLTAVAVAFIAAVSFGGAMVANMFEPASEWQRHLIGGGATLGGSVWALRATLFE